MHSRSVGKKAEEAAAPAKGRMQTRSMTAAQEASQVAASTSSAEVMGPRAGTKVAAAAAAAAAAPSKDMQDLPEATVKGYGQKAKGMGKAAEGNWARGADAASANASQATNCSRSTRQPAASKKQDSLSPPTDSSEASDQTVCSFGPKCAAGRHRGRA